MTGKKNVNSKLSPEQVAKIRRELEFNQRCATESEGWGQTDTCYHTTIKRLEAALQAEEVEENDIME